MIDICWEGHSRRPAPQNRHTAHLRRRAHCTPRKPSGWEGGGDKLHPQLGATTRAKHLVAWAAWTWDRRKTQAQPSLRLCGVPENLDLSGLDLGSVCKPGPASDSSRQSNLESEQCRLGKHTCHEQGQTQCGWITVSTCQWYLFAVFLPPQSLPEQTSLKKKKKKWPPPCPLWQGRT